MRCLLYEDEEFVTFLAWNGMVTSSFGLVSSILPIAMAADILTILNKSYSRKEYPKMSTTSTMFAAGIILFFIFLIWFWLNRKLRNSQNKIGPLKKICYTIAGLEIFINFGLGVLLILFHNSLKIGKIGNLSYLATLMQSNFFLGSFYIFVMLDLSFCCLLIHGVRKSESKHIRAFIIYSFVILVFAVFGIIVAGVYFSAVTSLSLIFFTYLLYAMATIYGFISYRGYMIALENFLDNIDNEAWNFGRGNYSPTAETNMIDEIKESDEI